MKKRYYAAMGCYAALAFAAYFQLSGSFRTALWILLAGLAVKTWIHSKRLGE
jgi:hypothetical protein